MIGHGRVSTTERVWSSSEGLISLKTVKIQSGPVGNHGEPTGAVWHLATKYVKEYVSYTWGNPPY